MPLLLQEVTEDAEFDELTQCEYEAFTNPLNLNFRLLRHDPSPAGFLELRDRQIRQWRADDTSRWFKVVDTEIGGRVVGGANWNTFLENPYTDEKKRGHPMEAEWWPEGEPREFGNKLLDCFLNDRWEKTAMPHTPMLFVHPEHRRRGVGTQLVQWGVEEADRLRLPSFIEASDDGKPMYEACGFVYAGTNYWEVAKKKPSKRWNELERFMGTPLHSYRLWRGIGGGDKGGGGEGAVGVR